MPQVCTVLTKARRGCQSDFLELELQMLVSCVMWVLGSKLTPCVAPACVTQAAIALASQMLGLQTQTTSSGSVFQHSGIKGTLERGMGVGLEIMRCLNQ